MDAPRPQASALRRLLPLVRPYRRWLVFASIVSMAALACQVAQPQIIRLVLDRAIIPKRRGLILPLGLIALGIGAMEATLSFIRRNASGKVSLGVEYDLRTRLYGKLQSLPVSFHEGWQSGQLVSRAISDISAIRRFIGFGLMWLAIFAAQFIVVLALLFRLDATLAWLVAVFIVPVGFLSYRFRRVYKRISRAVLDQLGDLTTVVEESAVGVRVIKAFGRSPERSAIFRKQAELVMKTSVRGVTARAHYWSLDALVLGLSTALVLLMGGLRVSHGQMTIGGLVAFVSYQAMLAWPVREFGWILAHGQEAMSAADRVFEIIDTPVAITDAPDARAIDSSEGRVRFEDVTFSYPGAGAEVLRGLNLSIDPGETLALVGMTGCGKTTVASLIARFQDPTSGRVTLDGHDLRSITLHSLRRQLGVAFEDPILFSASVRENLLMGQPDASDDELWAALAATQADEFVRELPWQLDTRVGEQGWSLSGGQRQRLALARAVVGGPRVLVLDDPMSSVDVHTEAAIEEALKGILVGRTAIIIAHRPSTLLLADRVALLHDGRIVATGTHHDLLETVPQYRDVLGAEHEEVRT